jgi:hypothetical protein
LASLQIGNPTLNHQVTGEPIGRFDNVRSDTIACDAGECRSQPWTCLVGISAAYCRIKEPINNTIATPAAQR